MRYYVVSDVHAHLYELQMVLEENGFYDDKLPHKLILCGDMMDRGIETIETECFMYDLMSKDELIFIRGNHEDLMVDLVNNFPCYIPEIRRGKCHHVSNGTFESAVRLSGMTQIEALTTPELFQSKVMESVFWRELLPFSVNYFETERYIFVHGYIPCYQYKKHFWGCKKYVYDSEWRDAPDSEWQYARWQNGMLLSEKHQVIEEGKIIVCGHYNASYGHSKIERKGREWGKEADHTIFYGKNVIGLDAVTAYTGQVNCLVIED